jgi:hypothetical protein
VLKRGDGVADKVTVYSGPANKKGSKELLFDPTLPINPGIQ